MAGWAGWSTVRGRVPAHHHPGRVVGFGSRPGHPTSSPTPPSKAHPGRVGEGGTPGLNPPLGEVLPGTPCPHRIQAGGGTSRRVEPRGCALPAGGTSFPGTRISAPSPEGTIPSLCSPSEGECIQGDLYLMGEGSSLHPEPPMGTQNPSSLRVGTPPGEGVPLEVHSSRGAPPVEGMRYSEVGTGEGYPRVRYEGGGWVGRGDRRGVRHPHQARFPYNSSRPRHTPRRDTLHPPTPLKPRPTSPRNTSHTHSEHTKPPIRTHKTYVLHTQNHALHQ